MCCESDGVTGAGGHRLGRARRGAVRRPTFGVLVLCLAAACETRPAASPTAPSPETGAKAGAPSPHASRAGDTAGAAAGSPAGAAAESAGSSSSGVKVEPVYRADGLPRPDAGGDDSRSGAAPTVPPAAPSGFRSGSSRGVGDAAGRELALGDAALRRKDPARALQHFRAARKLLPDHPAPVVGIVRARFSLLNVPFQYGIAPRHSALPELFELLDAASQLDGEFGPVYLERGRLELVRGRADDAKRHLERAAALLPDHPEAHSALAVANLATGDVAAAIAGFERARQLEPNDPDRLDNLGTAYMMSGDVAAAVRVYQRAAALAPNDARINGDLGTALLSAGQLQAAMPYLTRAHALAPDRATFMSNLCYAELQRQQLPEARGWCERATSADPKLGSAWINLGLVLAAEGKLDAAEKALQTAGRLDPSDPRVKANLEELRELRKTRR